MGESEDIEELRRLSIAELEAFLFWKRRTVNAKDAKIYRDIFHNKHWDYLWRSDGGTFVRKKYWEGDFPAWWVKHDYNAQNADILRKKRTKCLYMLDIALILQQDQIKGGYTWLNATANAIGAFVFGFGVAKR